MFIIYNIPAHSMCKESTKMVPKETVFLNLTDNSYKADNIRGLLEKYPTVFFYANT